MKKYIFTKDQSLFPISKTNNAMPIFGQAPPVKFTGGEIVEGTVSETNTGGIKSKILEFKTKRTGSSVFKATISSNIQGIVPFVPFLKEYTGVETSNDVIKNTMSNNSKNFDKQDELYKEYSTRLKVYTGIGFFIGAGLGIFWGIKKDSDVKTYLVVGSMMGLVFSATGSIIAIRVNNRKQINHELSLL
jgi:hypothetical protein